MRLKELRIMNGITQDKLAEDLGVDSRTIRRWETDMPATEIILKLANYFGVPFFELLSQNESMPNYTLGRSDSFNFEKIKHNTLSTMKILTKGDIIYNVNRKMYVKYTPELKEDITSMSLLLTDMYSKVLTSSSFRTVCNLLPPINTSEDNNYQFLRVYAIYIFHPSQGVFQCPEINNAIDKLVSVYSKYKPNPINCLAIPPHFGAFMIDLFLHNLRSTQDDLLNVCEQLYLELISCMGEEVTEDEWFLS